MSTAKANELRGAFKHPQQYWDSSAVSTEMNKGFMAIALIPYGRTIVMHISSHLLLSKGSHSRNCVNVALIFLTLPAGNSIVQQCAKEKARERESERESATCWLAFYSQAIRSSSLFTVESDIECVIYVPSDYEHFAVTLDIYSLFLFHFPPLRFMCHCFGVWNYPDRQRGSLVSCFIGTSCWLWIADCWS